ncbi:MAG: hypothetical protein CM1200mP18_19420 [Gammaproteobacteria bacterium]|nr:MAG: hypothetical protein CM1200mP18_19420 [Gammaproteobacteria bacterium]
MSKGAYDMVGCPEAYLERIPEAPVLRSLSILMPNCVKWAIDYVQKLMSEKNFRYIARYHNFGPFYLWLTADH